MRLPTTKKQLVYNVTPIQCYKFYDYQLISITTTILLVKVIRGVSDVGFSIFADTDADFAF